MLDFQHVIIEEVGDMSQPGVPFTIFCSYAHKDEALCRQLQTHLRVLERQGRLFLWHDRLIAAGSEWVKAIDEHLTAASLILLLISPDFLASDSCYAIEMSTALQRQQANQARVIPILLRPVHWQDAPFAYLKALPIDGKPITLWHNRDAAWTNVVTGIHQAINELYPLGASTSNAFPTIWNVPYPRNTFFTGREDLLATLVSHLRAYQPAALSQPQAMSGLGGVGKTQLAVEYAYRYAQDYEVVLWSAADSRETLISGFVELANLLNLPERNEADQSKSVAAVKHWLGSHGKWLLILDNADDLSLLNDFLPSVRPGHILFTTRAHALGGLATRIEVGTPTQQIGMLLLLRRAGLLALDAPLEQAEEADRVGAQQLWQALGGLPLALDQAGAYIEEAQCSVQDYLQLFQEQPPELLKQRGGILQDHPDSVYTTLSLSIGAAVQRDAAVVDLLRVCALLHPDGIPEELFRQGASHLGSALAPACAKLLAWNRLLATVSAYSLLYRQPAEKTLSMHRLVQAVLQDGMPEPEQAMWTERIIAVLKTAFPDPRKHTTWNACERLVPHVLTCTMRTRSWKDPHRGLASLLSKTAGYLAKRAQYLEAEPLYQRVLSMWEQARGPEHPQVAHSLVNLATLYEEQGKYTAAEPLYQRALHIHEQKLGPKHPQTAHSLVNLATLYREQRRYTEAEAFYQRALQIWEQAQGAEHPDGAYALHGLATLYRERGKYAEAELLCQRALRVREQARGPEHPDVAYPLTDLATLYREQGKYTEAEAFYQRALHIREQAQGPEHPQVAYSLSNLATLYREQGKYTAAEPLYQRALRIHEQVQGPEHPQTAYSLVNLATLYREQGKYTAAEPLYGRALQIWEQVRGGEHSDLAYPLIGLATLYREQGRYTEAESLYQRALRICELVRGPEHPQVAYSLHGLATLYREQGRYTEAEPLYKQAVHIWEQVRGPEHPQVAYSLHGLATLYSEQGKYAEAELLCQRALHIREQAQGDRKS